jgi:hypothetical protein
MSTTAHPERTVDQPPQHRPTPEWVSAAVVAAAVAGFSAWVLITLPLPAAFILVASGWLAFAAWLKTTYTYPVKSRKVLAVFLCAVAFQLIHMSEEYVGGFPTKSWTCSTPHDRGASGRSCSPSPTQPSHSYTSPGPSGCS